MPDAKEVLVTGGAGYLGSCLVPLLLDRGWRVAVYDTFSYGLGPLLPVAHRVRLIRGDVRDGAALASALKGVGAVVHLAAIVGFPACSRDPDLAEDVNGASRCVSPPCSAWLPGCAVDLLANDLSRRALRDGELEVYEPHFWRTFLHVRDCGESLRAGTRPLRRDARSRLQRRRRHSERDRRRSWHGLICERAGDTRLVLGASGRDQDCRDYRVSHARIRELGFRASISLEQGVDELIRVLPLMAPHELYMN
ncbi:hypothetical protein HPB51_018297 [Rhipicephalus microplus]|uniref:NAD-dependent epimerase/dehydratase domain-containing protein n=1 Tax=Rhipicephalus microplus TaxID=6941 RepID=A0A9J6DHY6_RHIMP|nr:hypothetical protein HPB51_018297 [Rhipicephalus microplus]